MKTDDSFTDPFKVISSGLLASRDIVLEIMRILFTSVIGKLATALMSTSLTNEF
jgi:hypothetical protein